MNLQDYQKVTGTTVSESDKPRIEAQLRKSQKQLETLLGFTLDPKKTNKNFYNEVGKTRTDWSYPDVDISQLLPPDEVVNAYRLYRYNPYDRFFFVDPFTAVHSVKLIYIKNGYPDESSITFKTFSPIEVRPQYGRDGVGKYIERVRPYLCNFDYVSVQLAVDADWCFSSCLSDDLKYLLAEMVDYSLDDKSNIRSESIEGHSYSKFDKVSPENEKENMSLIRGLAGPYGSASGYFQV